MESSDNWPKIALKKASIRGEKNLSGMRAHKDQMVREPQPVDSCNVGKLFRYDQQVIIKSSFPERFYQ